MNKTVVESSAQSPSTAIESKDWIYTLRHRSPEQLQNYIESIKRLGIQRLALDAVQPIDETRIDELSRTTYSLSQSGLTTFCLNLQLNGPFSPLGRARAHVKNEIKQLKFAINAASKIGIKHICVEIAPQPVEANQRRLQDDLYTYALEVMHGVRYEAESRAVSLAIVVGKAGFLGSLAEARNFIDECNSPWIGVCLPLADICRSDSPVDWILTLGRRVFSCLIELSSSELNFEKVLENGYFALRNHNPLCSIMIRAIDLAETQMAEGLNRLHDMIEPPRVA